MSQISPLTVPDREGLPDLMLTSGGNTAAVQLVTQPNVQWMLGELGIALAWNQMQKVRVFRYPGVSDTDTETQEQLEHAVVDMALRMGMKDRNRLDELLTALARLNRFHPMANWIDSVPWDGVDRIPDLAASLSSDTPLLPTYLRRMGIQLCEAVYGWDEEGERSLSQVLVLVGKQGLGKGRWLRSLAPGFVLADAELHLNSTMGKDHQMQVLRYPLVELGELDSTFRKSDVSAMKAFLSRPVDEIREPYSRRAIPQPRGTVFIGTVNVMQFLGDITGNRRFWPVQIHDKINWDHGIDMQQFWAQMAELWESGEDWMLSSEEYAEHQADALRHTMTSAVIDKLEYHLADYGEVWDGYVAANKTQILQLLGIEKPSMAELADATQWLTDTLGEAGKVQGRQRSWVFPGGPRIHSGRNLMPVSETLAKKWALRRPASVAG